MTNIDSAISLFRFFDKHGVGNYLLNECKTKSDEHVEIAVRYMTQLFSLILFSFIKV